MNIWQTIKENPTALIWALVVHLLVFVAIGVSFKASDPKISEVKKEKVIAAVAIDEAQVNAEINKLKKAEERKVQKQKRLQAEERRAKNERRKEEKKIQALKKEQKKQALLLKKKQQAEKKRLAELEKKRQAEEQQQKEIEQKRKETEKKISQLEKMRQEKQAQIEKEEQARKDEIARKEKAAAEQRRAEQEQSEIAKFKSLIKGAITNKWILPASYQKGMKCKVLVRLIPSGDVVSVRVIESSGNKAFDSSVEMAVSKASPLPVPEAETDLFRHFREVEFLFDPNA